MKKIVFFTPMYSCNSFNLSPFMNNHCLTNGMSHISSYLVPRENQTERNVPHLSAQNVKFDWRKSREPMHLDRLCAESTRLCQQGYYLTYKRWVDGKEQFSISPTYFPDLCGVYFLSIVTVVFFECAHLIYLHFIHA